MAVVGELCASHGYLVDSGQNPEGVVLVESEIWQLARAFHQVSFSAECRAAGLLGLLPGIWREKLGHDAGHGTAGVPAHELIEVPGAEVRMQQRLQIQ